MRRRRQRWPAVSVLIIGCGGRLEGREVSGSGGRASGDGMSSVGQSQSLQPWRVPASAALSTAMITVAGDERWRQVAALFARRRRRVND